MRKLPLLIIGVLYPEFINLNWQNWQFKFVGQVVQATPPIAQAASQNPNKAGWDFYQAGQYEQAIAQFQQASQQNPNNAKPYWGLTLTYNKLQRYTEAQQALNQAAKLDPAITFTSRANYDKFRQLLARKVSTSTRQATTPTQSGQTTPPAKTNNPNQTGWALYKAEQYQQAIQQFQQAIQRNPNNVKPFWGLALAYNKLNRPHEALAALDQAASIDPAITFTARDNYNKFRQALERKVQSTPEGSQSAPQNTTAQLNALKSGVAYVDPTMARVVDLAQLQQMAMQLQPFTVKFLVLPTVSGDRQQYAQQMFEYLNLNNAAFIVATQKGVDLYSDRLSPETAVELAQASRIDFTPTHYTPGLVKLAQSVANEVRQTEQTEAGLGLGLLGLLGAGGVGAIVYRRQSWQKALARVQDLRQQVAQAIDNTEGFTDVLGAGAAAETTRQQAQLASNQFVEASTILDVPPRKRKALKQAETLLRSSLERIQNVQAIIDLAAQGQDITAAVAERFEANPTTLPTEEAADHKRAACFFCSRPITFRKAQSVQIPVNNTLHRVLACSECATQISNNQRPPIRAIYYENRYIPWYRYPSYDPFRDYYNSSGHWSSVSIDVIEHPYNYDSEVVITPDHSEYRDYTAQVAEQESDFLSTFENWEETPRETDFMGADLAAEEWSNRETNFLGNDRS
jgi:tetratricopeptide (TPR) repeat protein